MSNIHVAFHLPTHIESGLISGSMERVGGVIRYSDSKQIIAWLREGIDTSQTSPNILQAFRIAPQFASSLMGQD